jgi:hypothetical protein
MPNPYAQVALTYVRRWWSFRNAWTIACVLFVAIVFATVVHDRLSSPILFFFVFMTINLFVALSSHIRQQFADSRSRLTPGFCRVHAAVAIAVALIVAALVPGALAWMAGLHSVGLVAIALCLFSAVFWAVLLVSAWLTAGIAALLAMGCLALFIQPACEIQVQFLRGEYEPLAIALLVAGLATMLLGMRRLAQLNEDMPWYRGWAVGSMERSRMASQPANKRVSQHGLRSCPGSAAVPAAEGGQDARAPAMKQCLRQRAEDRRIAHLLEHVRQAPVSWWSGVCRWQMTPLTSWPVWLISVLMTIVLLLLWTWIIGRGGGGFGPRLFLLASFGFWTCIPVAVSVGQLMQRTGKMGHELLLPVERRLYVRQGGAVAALSQLQLWSAVSVAMLLWWLIVDRTTVSHVTVASMLGLSALSQLWTFAAATWLVRFGTKTIFPLGMVAAMAIGWLAPTLTGGFTAAPRLSEWQHVVWNVAGLLTVLSAFAAWAAYRRWLVTDIG